ncbi:SPFH domain-containing protein [Actinokineospora sp. NPDC004072]
MVFYIVLLLLVGVAVGGALVFIRGMRTLPLDQYALVSSRFAGLRRVSSREEYLLRHTRIVLGGQPSWLPQWLYRVETYDYVRVPPGSVGLVVAKIGTHKPTHRQLAKHVECARFQDAARFLDNGGEQGVQPELLLGGEHYAINPLLFDVFTVNNPPSDFPVTADDLRLVSVDAEDVGVVIVHDAPAPDDQRAPAPVVPGHANFQQPWTFLAAGGRSGPQTEILPGGAKYAIHPMFARVVHIPTRELTLTWQAKSGAEDRYDSDLAPLNVTIEGYDLQVDLTQTLSIPPYAAPYLVKRFGEDSDGDVGDRKSTAVKRFVSKVLGEKVKGYFTERAAAAEIDRFIHELADLRGKLKVQITQALAEVQVEAYETTIGEIRFASDELNQEYRKYAQLRQRYRQREQELAIERVTTDIEREKLKVTREQLAAQEQVLIALFGAEHRRKERREAIAVRAQPPMILLPGGGMVGGPPVQVPQATPIAVPEFDPTRDMDLLDASPGVPTDRKADAGDRE